MILLVFGIVMMFSASYADAISKGRSGTFYARKQIIMAGVGVVAMFLLSHIDYHVFFRKSVAYLMFAGCVLLLILVIIPGIGVDHNGAQRWLQIGIKIGFEYQPSEIMKFSIIILFSYLITINGERMGKFKTGILPYMVMLGVVAALMMKQPHLSGTLIICMLGVILIFIGGAKLHHLLLTGAVGLGGLAAVVFYMSAKGYTYFSERFQSWIDPASDKTGDTYQTWQSLIAIGSGGLFGLGLGESRQKYFIPETQNDFVFAIICEELGFVGAVTVILLFAMFVFRGFYIASKAPDKFGMLICVGLTVQVAIQAFLNIAVVSNFIPNTGISMPFFSYGGTSLVMLLAQMGIILNISRQAVMDVN